MAFDPFEVLRVVKRVGLTRLEEEDDEQCRAWPTRGPSAWERVQGPNVAQNSPKFTGLGFLIK